MQRVEAPDEVDAEPDVAVSAVRPPGVLDVEADVAGRARMRSAGQIAGDVPPVERHRAGRRRCSDRPGAVLEDEPVVEVVVLLVELFLGNARKPVWNSCDPTQPSLNQVMSPRNIVTDDVSSRCSHAAETVAAARPSSRSGQHARAPWRPGGSWCAGPGSMRPS